MAAMKTTIITREKPKTNLSDPIISLESVNHDEINGKPDEGEDHHQYKEEGECTVGEKRFLLLVGRWLLWFHGFGFEFKENDPAKGYK